MPDTPDFPFIAKPDTSRLAVLAREVYLLCGGGRPTPDLPIDERECRLAVEHVYESRRHQAEQYNKDRLQKDFAERLALDKQRYFDLLNARKEDGTNAAYLFPFIKPVLTDALTGQPYCELPESFVAQGQYELLPGEELVTVCEPVQYAGRRKVVYRLFGTKAQAEQFMRCYGLAPDYGFYRAGERVYLTYDPVAQEGVPDTTLQLWCVVRPERDKLPAPGLMDAMDAADIVNKAYALVMQRVPADKKNDNSPTLR